MEVQGGGVKTVRDQLAP